MRLNTRNAALYCEWCFVLVCVCGKERATGIDLLCLYMDLSVLTDWINSLGSLARPWHCRCSCFLMCQTVWHYFKETWCRCDSCMVNEFFGCFDLLKGWKDICWNVNCSIQYSLSFSISTVTAISSSPVGIFFCLPPFFPVILVILLLIWKIHCWLWCLSLLIYTDPNPQHVC